VPPEQVIDTVDLYFLKARQRRLSLRFLSWFVLHEHIQTDMHDSIEDARSALNLYKAYHDFEGQGIFDQKLEELYKEGRLYVGGVFTIIPLSFLTLWQNFKPPPPPESTFVMEPGPAPIPSHRHSNSLPGGHLGKMESDTRPNLQRPLEPNVYLLDSSWRR
jgi:PAB-dependent poly(A)-specific ribonuclease subunit 2